MYCNIHDCRNNKDGYCELIDYLTINRINRGVIYCINRGVIYCENYEPKFDNEEE